MLSFSQPMDLQGPVPERTRKIVDIDAIMVRLPVVRPIADGAQSIMILKIRTDDGLIGIGEVHTNPLVSQAVLDAPVCSAASRGLREILIGEDANDIQGLWTRMYRYSSTFGRRGAVMHVMSGVDIALWDLRGKAEGKPIYELLGGAKRKRHRLYASDLSPDTDEQAVAQAVSHVENGFGALKFGWGGLGAGLEADADRIRQVRRAVGPDVDIMIDFGYPLDIDYAIGFCRRAADERVFFVEEPLDPRDLEGFARLVDASPVPIATGEKEDTLEPYLDLMDRGKVRIIQPDLARAGGFTECLRIQAAADERGALVIPHCWSSDILVAASLHFISVAGTCPYLEFNVLNQPIRTELSTTPFKPVDGALSVPEAPGLGVELNEDFIEHYRWDA